MGTEHPKNKDGSLNKELTKNPGEAQRIIIGTPDPQINRRMEK